ncbi:hypothetical protein ACEN9H_22390 [Massilia cellulosiltytica]|uniref:hypothetical protein n=1 Tax=Massilia cellulosiltytica TaxID=2683234 RepID=UPI0039B59933
MKIIRYIFPLLISACAIDPAATNDYTGLGNSEVATQLKHSLFLGEVAVDHAIGNLVNSPRVVNQVDRRKALEELGFICPPETDTPCSYDGSAKSIIVSADRKDTTRFVTRVHIQALLSNRVVKVESHISKTDF